MERTFDGVILKAKLEQFIIESKKNIDSKIQKINSYLLYMKEENDQIISKSNLFYFIQYYHFLKL